MAESYPTNLAAVPVVSAGEKGYLVQLVSPEGDKVFPVISANMIYDENGNEFSIPDTVNSVNNAINQVNTVLNNLNTTINNKFTQMNGTMDAATLQGHTYQNIIDAVPPYVHPNECQCNVTTELNSLKTSVSENKTNVAAAVTGKGVQTAADAAWDTIITNINRIQVGIDTSSATATSSDIKAGKTAYARGSKLYGTYTPPVSNKLNLNNVSKYGLDGRSNLAEGESINLKGGLVITFGTSGSFGTYLDILDVASQTQYRAYGDVSDYESKMTTTSKPTSFDGLTLTWESDGSCTFTATYMKSFGHLSEITMTWY